MWFSVAIGWLLGVAFGHPLLGAYIGLLVGITNKLRAT